MRDMTETVRKLKMCIMFGTPVTVRFSNGDTAKYMPKEFVYWYDGRTAEWRYSLTLTDMNRTDSLITVPLQDIEFE